MRPKLRQAVDVAIAVLAVLAFVGLYLWTFAPFAPYIFGREPWPYQ